MHCLMPYSSNQAPKLPCPSLTHCPLSRSTLSPPLQATRGRRHGRLPAELLPTTAWPLCSAMLCCSLHPSLPSPFCTLARRFPGHSEDRSRPPASRRRGWRAAPWPGQSQPWLARAWATCRCVQPPTCSRTSSSPSTATSPAGRRPPLPYSAVTP